MIEPALLVLNPGSSTLKYALYEGLERQEGATLQWRRRDNDHAGHAGVEYGETVREVASRAGRAIDAVGFRVVHGGSDFTQPTIVSREVLRRLESTVDLAPLHQPPALAAMHAALEVLPGALQIACFDTAFHATLPDVEKRFAIADSYFQAGIRRYGFHGLSFESIAGALESFSPRAARGRTVVCHLGNGASLCGMRDGKSHVTTMGMTPLDGLVMGTRSGRIDAGVPIHWMRHGWDADRIETVLTKESGLLGISGLSSDMRHLLGAYQSHSPAGTAFEMFCHSVAKEIASAAVVLEGLDAIVFTAGIGENSPEVRARIVQKLGWLGASMNDKANEKNEHRLHDDGSRIEIHRIPTDEQQVIAKHVLRLLQSHTA